MSYPARVEGLVNRITLHQCGPGCHGYKAALCLPQSFTITGASHSDCLVSYTGHSLGMTYHFVEMQSVYSTPLANWAFRWESSTPLQRCNGCISQLQRTRLTKKSTDYNLCRHRRWSSVSHNYTSISLLHNLKKACKGIGFNVSTNKIDFMYFKDDGAISILTSPLLKLVDQFPSDGSNISSTESDVEICSGKTCTAVER